MNIKLIKRLRHPLVWAVLAVFVLALPVLSYPMGRDQAAYANIGRSILGGGTPYLDMWDLKPPPIYYIYAFGIQLFGTGWGAIRALDLLFVPLGMVGLYAVGKRLFSPAIGVWGAFFYGAFYFSETFSSITQSDSLVTIPMIWAVLCAVLAVQSTPRSHSSWGFSMLTGVICGLVLWFKQYQAFFVVALILNHILTRKSHPRALLEDAVCFAIGGIVSAGILFVYFWQMGIFSEMLLIAEGASGYNTRLNDFASVLAQLWHYAQFRWLHWGLLLLFVGAWLPIRLIAKDSTHAQGWRLVGLWLLSGLAFVVAQRLGFDTHWLPMLPALALFGAYSADALVRWINKPAVLWAFVGMVALVPFSATWVKALPYYAGTIDQEAYYRQFPSGDFRVWESLSVVEYLRPRLVAGDTLFTWGFRPEVAYMGQWQPPTRFQFHQPTIARWFPQEWQEENVQTLWAAMPSYVLILQNDNMPWVTGEDKDSNTLLQGYTELNNWLMANYERETQIGEFFVWHRMTP